MVKRDPTLLVWQPFQGQQCETAYQICTCDYVQNLAYGVDLSSTWSLQTARDVVLVMLGFDEVVSKLLRDKIGVFSWWIIV